MFLNSIRPTKVVIGMISLGAYWSEQAYDQWEAFPVLTTLANPAFPVYRIEFPGLPY